MDRLAFFWVGEDITIPSILVQSALLVYENNVQIIQLTDLETPRVSGVTQIYRSKLSENIMLARLEAYSLVPSDDVMTFYVDADSVILNKIELSELNSKNGFFVKRLGSNQLVNHMHPEYYPEFEGKFVGDVMPLLFGAIAICNGKNFFQELLNICLNLPERFHRWYGDQVALKLKMQEQESFFNYIDGEKYLFILDAEISKEDLIFLKKLGVKMISAKGPQMKNYLNQILLNLKEISN